MLASQYREKDSGNPRVDDQRSQTEAAESSSTGFDARQRLDGRFDDTTVRQAVLGMSISKE